VIVTFAIQYKYKRKLFDLKNISFLTKSIVNQKFPTKEVLEKIKHIIIERR